ncbi:conserved hypothetical protein [Altererythrobacter sp. B11]|uniref:hypothetical protein n=1 Tax=Altererythrobacter sp. B11 TaxID=2060312 RepID=UPI000DC6DD0C|nr:hypothetical protein [Altererythrobacter sp. B11]BBC71150.1 conserved hypothetical protein [Altererythrobacter sp. B11]
MRNPLAAAILLAPLALLAACGDSKPAEEAQTEVAAAPAAPAMPEVPADALDSVNYAGTYALTRINGSQAKVTLNPEDTSYKYVAANGKESEGKFSRVDGNRIMIDDLDGKPGYFAIADGAIYYLPDADTGVDKVLISNMYRRDDAPVEAASASTAPATEKSA